MKDDVKFVRDNLGRHKVFVLGTTDDQGRPWVVSLHLVVDEQYNIIWKSRKDTKHSEYVRQRPEVSICVFSDDPGVGDFGLYAYGKAREVTDKAELKKLLALRFKVRGKPVPSVEDFLASADRIYIAELYEAWINDESYVKRSLDLKALKDGS